MPEGTLALIRLEAKRLFGINRFFITKDKKERKRKLLLMIAYAILLLVLIAYSASFALGLSSLGLSASVPAFLSVISFVFCLFFGLFTAGSTLFNKKGREITESLPVSKVSVVLSRFFAFYTENLAFTLPVCLPGLTVSLAFARVPFLSWLMLPFVLLIMPLLPSAVSAVFGTIVSLISVLFPRKTLAQTLLTIIPALAVLFFTGAFAPAAEGLTEDVILRLASRAEEMITSAFPPALLVKNTLIGADALSFAVFTLLSAALFAAVVVLTARLYRPLSEKLAASRTAKSFKKESYRQKDLLSALIQKEFRRYFASSVYVTNTIIGPILAVGASVSLLFTDIASVLSFLPFPVPVSALAPYLSSGIMLLMCPACTSLSMEGKNLWLIKSLPVNAKDVFKAKILMTFLFILPFAFTSSVILLIALEQTLTTFVSTLITPVILTFTVSVLALSVNLRLPVFDWDQEVYVIKQSASAAVAGFSGPIVCLVSALPALLLPENLKPAAIIAVPALLLFFAWRVYSGMTRRSLSDL